jgi:hypothetical protein
LATVAGQRRPTPPFDADEGREHFVSQHLSFPAAPHAQHLLRRRAEELLEAAAGDADAVAAEAKEAQAAQLFLQHQSLTFQHLFLHQYTKRLARAGLKKSAKATDCAVQDDEQLTEQQRMNMMFRGLEEERGVGALIGALPPAWTVVQISCAGGLAATRFKRTKRGEASPAANPPLCLLRLRYLPGTYAEMEFLDISLSKDSRLFLRAIFTVPSTGEL